MRILLVDKDAKLVNAWQEVFKDEPDLVAKRADFFETNAAAMVSPANSFGIMDGGLDRAIADVIGGVARRVRSVIEERHHGELPIGVAEIVPTGDARWPLLVCAPTMRVPEDVSRTTNAYLAFRAVLLAVKAHELATGTVVESLVCPGLCTGVGAMPPRRCAAQMRIALRQVRQPPKLPSFADIHRTHLAMRTES
jgi:O-acetyl-ADP-ribose deacetylase (regulator of RNase III)